MAKEKWELRPCPFCGSRIAPGVFTLAEIEYTEEDEDRYEYDSRHYAVCCDMTKGGCGVQTGNTYVCTCEEDAVVRWNTRWSPSPNIYQ